ncbi:MAG TPA: iron ABC transporter permease [Ktedonobacteraceae bacterium]|jgi:iron(III) transport system permease protein
MVPQQHRAITTVGEQEQGSVEQSTLPTSTFRRSAFLRYAGVALIVGVPVLILVLFVLYPLAAIILQSIFPNLYALNPNLVPSLGPLVQVFSSAINYQALGNSLWLSGVTALLASVLGTLLAVLARRTDLPLRGTIDTLVWIVFFFPSFLLGEAWSLVMIRGGIPDQYFHFSDGLINWFFSPVGVIFILSLKTFPYVYLSVTAALRWLGSEFEDAARLSGARLWRSWLSINVPLLLPAIFAGGLIAFAEAISDFGTAATIAQSANVTLVTYQIYAAINTSPVNFALAAAFSLLLFVAIALALLTQAGVQRRKSFQVISGRSRPARPVSLGLWKWPALLFVLLVFLMALVIPLGMCLVLSFLQAFGNGLTASNLTLANYATVLTQGSDSLGALMRTIWLALGTATVTTLLGLPIAFIIKRTRLPGRTLLSMFTLVTIAVPGIILACGYIFAWNAPYLENIGMGGPNGWQFYGTVWLLFCAYIGGSLPYATRLSIGALEQVGANLLETARVQGANVLQLMIRIVGPLLRENLASIWLLVFTGTMFELAASELLYPPGEPTMPVQIVTLFDDFKLGPGMALSMLNVGIVTLALVVLRLLPWIIGRVRQSKKVEYVFTDQTAH